MKTIRLIVNTAALTFLVFACMQPANATNARSWVASNGSDANPCTRSAPCATFSAAIVATQAGGEINCVDAGEFQTGTTFTGITKALTIDCGGTGGYISGPAFSINANANSDTVTIRNLSVDLQASNSVGLNYIAAKAVHLENVNIFSTTGDCIEVQATASALLTIDNASISDCGLRGILAGTASGSGTVVVNINNSRVFNTGSGILADNGSRVTVRDSTVYFNQVGIGQSNVFGTNLGSTVTIINSTLGYSNTAALRSLGGEFLLTFGNTFVNDVIALSPNGGLIFSGGDNNNSGSTQGTANGGVVPKF